MLMGLHRPGSLLHRVHQPRVCLDFKHRFWWGLIMRKSKQQPAEEQGIGSSDLQFSLQTSPCSICMPVDEQQRGSRVLRHFEGSIAAGAPCSVGRSWEPQAKRTGWSLSRPQGFQNIGYPWARSAHLQHIAFSLCHLFPSKHPTTAFSVTELSSGRPYLI